MIEGWYEILFRIYRDCRKNKYWFNLYDCHDDEDKRYFDMLDERLEKKIISDRSRVNMKINGLVSSGGGE